MTDRGTPPGATLGAAEALVGAVSRLLGHHGFLDVLPDPILDGAARALLARLGGAQMPDPLTAAAHLRFVLEQASVGDADVVPLVVPFDANGGESGLAGALATVLPKLDRRRPPTHLGLAVRSGEGPPLLALVLVHRGVRLDAPLPQLATAGQVVRLAGDLRPGYFRPWVVVAPPGQPILQRPAWTESRRAEVNLYLDAGPGVYGVELLAESQFGPVVLLNGRIYVDVPAPERPTVVLRPPAGQGASDLQARVDAWRRAAGLSALKPHPALASAAATHAQELARTGRLTHASADSGTLRMRLLARGLEPPVVAENLAEAADAGAAFAAFLDSPGHARNLLLPGLTHAAVAVEGRYWVLALATLVAPPSAQAPATAPPTGPERAEP